MYRLHLCFLDYTFLDLSYTIQQHTHFEMTGRLEGAPPAEKWVVKKNKLGEGRNTLDAFKVRSWILC